jgi:hypothetical protein
VALAVLAPTGVAGGQELDDFEQRVTRAIEIAEEGLQGPRPELMEEVRRALGLPDRVLVAGRPVDVAPDPVLSSLTGASIEDFDVAHRRLRAIRAAAAEAAAIDPPPQDDLRRDLATAQQAVGPVEPSLVERIIRFVNTVLNWVVRRGVGALRGGPGWVVLAGLVALAAVMILRLRPGRAPLATMSGPTGPAAAEWRTRAEEARRRGDMTAAIVALYRSLVAGLAERGLVEDRPSLTAGEVRAAAAGDPRLEAILGEATRRYERVRYGLALPGEEDLHALLRAERGARVA